MRVQILSSTVSQHAYKEINVVQLHITANDKHCGGRVLLICTNFLMSCSSNNLDRKVAKLLMPQSVKNLIAFRKAPK